MTTVEDAARRAMLMTGLPERDRNVMIALGVLGGVVIDARRRFDRDFMALDMGALGIEDFFAVTTTVFDGVFGPGEGDAA